MRNGESVDVIGEWLLGASTRYDVLLPHSRIADEGREAVENQGLMVKKLDRVEYNGLRNAGHERERAGIQVAAAPRAGIWLGAPPSKALDLRLTNDEVRSRVWRRLGCEICKEKPCPFCLGVMNKWEIHAESCTGGGDKTYGHHIVRNDLFTQSKRGNMGPVLEANGVLNTLGVEDRGAASHGGSSGRERPADVLSCRAQDVRTGNGQRGNGRVALDVGDMKQPRDVFILNILFLILFA